MSGAWPALREVPPRCCFSRSERGRGATCRVSHPPAEEATHQRALGTQALIEPASRDVHVSKCRSNRPCKLTSVRHALWTEFCIGHSPATPLGRTCHVYGLKAKLLPRHDVFMNLMCLLEAVPAAIFTIQGSMCMPSNLHVGSLRMIQQAPTQRFCRVGFLPYRPKKTST